MHQDSQCRSRPKRVVVVAYTEYPWDARVRREAETLAADGWEVHAITIRPESGPSPVSTSQVHLHELPLRIKRGGIGRYFVQYGAFLLLSSALLVGLQFHRRPEVIHVHTLPDFQVFSALIPKIMHASILLDMHEAMPELFLARIGKPPTSLSYRLLVGLQVLSCRFADHVVVACDSIKSSLVASGVAGGKITTVPNMPEYGSAAEAPDGMRPYLDMTPKGLIVHAGGINPERDLDTLVRAIAELSPRHNISLALAGAGNPEYIQSLLRLGARLGIADRVHYFGRLSPSAAHWLMAQSEVGVVTLVSNPHTELSLPARVAEFVRLGKPLVVADLRFLRGFLGSAARYYTPRDASSLAGAIEAGLAQDVVPNETAAVNERVSRYFEPARAQAALRDAYRQLEVIND